MGPVNRTVIVVVVANIVLIISTFLILSKQNIRLFCEQRALFVADGLLFWLVH